jgi:hypothetical protein
MAGHGRPKDGVAIRSSSGADFAAASHAWIARSGSIFSAATPATPAGRSRS